MDRWLLPLELDPRHELGLHWLLLLRLHSLLFERRSKVDLATCDTLLRCRGHTGEQACFLSDWLSGHALEGTVGALTLQRLASLSTDQLMLLSVPGELLLEVLGGVAVEHCAPAWLLNYDCRINFMHAIGLRTNGRCAVAPTELLSFGEPAVRLVEAVLATELLSLTLQLVWRGVKGLLAALLWIGWHIVIRVGF